MHRHYPHTVGDDACAWFGLIPSIAQVVGSIWRVKKCYGLGVHPKRHVGGILIEMGR